MAEPDLRFLQEQLRRANSQNQGQSDDNLAIGGGGPHDPGMEARVAALEADMKEVKTDLKRIGLDVAEIKGRVANLPTTLQIVFIQAGLTLTTFGIAVASMFALIKLVHP